MSIFICTIHTHANVDIAQEPEPDYETTRVGYVGCIDPYGMEGLVVLRANSGREFHVRAFSGEVAKYITHVIEEADGVEAPDIPSIYGMVSEICEINEIALVKVKIYESGRVLRASLYMTGKKDIVLKNHRASDAITLATLYKIPILVRSSLLRDHDEAVRETSSDSP